MKKTIISTLAVAAILAVSCAEPEQKEQKLSKVSIDPEEIELLEGETKTLEIVTEPAGFAYNSVSWQSSDKNVATISRKGVLTAVTEGEAEITAEVDGFTATCYVTVKPNITPVSGVSLDQTEAVIEVGNTLTLTATVAPEEAADKTVTWSSSNNDVASVTEGIVTAVAKGECDIVVKTTDGGYEASCHVRVSAPAVVYTFNMPNGDWAKNGYPVFSKDLKKAYFVGLHDSHSIRALYEVDLENKSLGWTYDLTNSETAWAGNPGDICVNPSTGDIICCNQCEVFCIKSDGSKRWSIGSDVTGLASSNTAQAMLGCGPAMSNDCSVIFACVKNNLLAIKADDGSVLDTYESLSAGCQIIVYGDNKIIAAKNVAAGGIIFLSFSDNKFTEDAKIDLPANGLSDISSGAMTRDQKKAYFVLKAYTVCVDIENKTLTYENKKSMGIGYRWSPTITSDGYLMMACQWNGDQSTVEMLNTASAIDAEDNGEVIYSYKGANGLFNHEGIALDSENNIYCYLNDIKSYIEEGETKTYLIRLSKGTDGFDATYLASLEGVANGTFQGQFNFGGNYAIAIQGKPGKVCIFELEAARGKGWTGNGGDPQGTKNANLAYAE